MIINVKEQAYSVTSLTESLAIADISIGKLFDAVAPTFEA